MSKAAQELYHLLKGMTSTDANVFPAIVKKINSDDTIDVELDGLVLPDVQCQSAVINGQKGIKIKPAIDSVVMVEHIGDRKSDEYMVVLYSDIDEHSIEIATMKFLMDANGLLVKKGNDTLLEALELIIEGVMQIIVLKGRNPNYAKLQQALTKLKNILR